MLQQKFRIQTMAAIVLLALLLSISASAAGPGGFDVTATSTPIPKWMRPTRWPYCGIYGFPERAVRERG